MRERASSLKQTHLHGGNTVFLDVDFPHRRAEERSLLAPIIIIIIMPILGIIIVHNKTKCFGYRKTVSTFKSILAKGLILTSCSVQMLAVKALLFPAS